MRRATTISRLPPLRNCPGIILAPPPLSLFHLLLSPAPSPSRFRSRLRTFCSTVEIHSGPWTARQRDSWRTPGGRSCVCWGSGLGAAHLRSRPTCRPPCPAGRYDNIISRDRDDQPQHMQFTAQRCDEQGGGVTFVFPDPISCGLAALRRRRRCRRERQSLDHKGRGGRQPKCDV